MITPITGINRTQADAIFEFFKDYGHRLDSAGSVSERIRTLQSTGRDELYVLYDDMRVMALIHLRIRTNLDHFSSYTEIVEVLIHPALDIDITSALILGEIVAISKKRGSCGLWIAFAEMDPSARDHLFGTNAIIPNGVLLEKTLDQKNSTAVPAGMVLRDACDDDAETLARLMLNLDTPGISPQDLRVQMRAVKKYDSDSFFVCDYCREIVGLCYYRDRYDFLDNETIGEAVLLSVDGSRRKIGIGRALLARAESIASQRGCRRMWICSGNNPRELASHEFYLRLGYRQIGHKLERLF